jgi:predicted naringenin-chalcone synthase
MPEFHTRQSRPAAPAVYLNAVGTAVPADDVHARALAIALDQLDGRRERAVFARMAERSGIASRHSVLRPSDGTDAHDTDGFYRPGAFPSTARRMGMFEARAPALADAAVDDLAARLGPGWSAGIGHVIVTCCTGFSAPGLDQHVVARNGLDDGVERTFVGFMGCSAAFNGLKLARHIVRSEPAARVLVVNVELCTLHLQETADLEQTLLFLLFADGAAASLVSAEPTGVALDRFASGVLPDSGEAITWRIGDDGFDMRLSGAVPHHIRAHVPGHVAALLGQERVRDVAHWAVHPGGKSVLDAVEAGLDLAPDALAPSRRVLQRFGNMSSATVMFVMQALLEARPAAGSRGVALGFGPGLGVESFTFAGT